MNAENLGGNAEVQRFSTASGAPWLSRMEGGGTCGSGTEGRREQLQIRAPKMPRHFASALWHNFTPSCVSVRNLL